MAPALEPPSHYVIQLLAFVAKSLFLSQFPPPPVGRGQVCKNTPERLSYRESSSCSPLFGGVWWLHCVNNVLLPVNLRPAIGLTFQSAPCSHKYQQSPVPRVITGGFAPLLFILSHLTHLPSRTPSAAREIRAALACGSIDENHTITIISQPKGSIYERPNFADITGTWFDRCAAPSGLKPARA